MNLLVDITPGTEQIYEQKQRLKNQLQQAFGRNVDLCREEYLEAYFKTPILKSVIDV